MYSYPSRISLIAFHPSLIPLIIPYTAEKTEMIVRTIFIGADFLGFWKFI